MRLLDADGGCDSSVMARLTHCIMFLKLKDNVLYMPLV